jgi:DNA-binding Lrp family transcriptional regulator
MRLGEILEQVQGLDKRFVHYLEAQGYIEPVKVPKQRIARREYTERDLRTIEALWRYYQRGMSLQRAAALLEQPERVQAYLLVRVPGRQCRAAFEAVQAYQFVEAAAGIYGDVADLLLTVSAPDESDLYELIVGAFAQAHLSATPSILRVHDGYRRWRTEAGPRLEGRPGMQAYVLLTVPAKHAGGVFELLQTMPGVVEAAVIYGETDIIAKVSVSSPEALDDLVINQLQGIPAVESTRTFIVVGSMSWQRNGAPRATGERAVAGTASV